MNKQVQSTILLVLCAMIWGLAFVAQRSGMDHIGPFLFSTLRMYIGALALLPVIFINDYFKKRKQISTADNKTLIVAGISCGCIMFFATNFQQVGLVFTTAAKTGFITTLYIVLVPLFGIFLKHKVKINSWIGVAVATVGLYFLCITESFTISYGDFIVLMGAGFWAAHILFIDHFAPKVDVFKLCCIQSFVAGIISMIVAIAREPIVWDSIVGAAPSFLYVGILSSGVAYTFQALGQKHANPTAASIILSTESVFAAVGGVILLHEVLSNREWLGCALMFIAVIVTQLPVNKKEL